MIEMGSDFNHAMIGNLLMEREDGEPVPVFRARARDTALGIGADILIFSLLDPVVWVDDLAESGPEIITISGGLERDASGDFAQFGDVLLERADGESVEDFQIRAREAARVAGVEFVTFGGLRPMPTGDKDRSIVDQGE